jgi:hypothetical protein
MLLINGHLQLVLVVCLSSICTHSRPALGGVDISWLLPSSGSANDAASARGPLARVAVELLVGGSSSEIRKQAAAFVKAIWRVLEGQTAVEAQQVIHSAVMITPVLRQWHLNERLWRV